MLHPLLKLILKDVPKELCVPAVLRLFSQEHQYHMEIRKRLYNL